MSPNRESTGGHQVARLRAGPQYVHGFGRIAAKGAEMADPTRGWLVFRADLPPDWDAFYAYWHAIRAAAERKGRQAGIEAFEAQRAAASILLEAARAEQESRQGCPQCRGSRRTACGQHRAAPTLQRCLDARLSGPVGSRWGIVGGRLRAPDRSPRPVDWGWILQVAARGASRQSRAREFPSSGPLSTTRFKHLPASWSAVVPRVSAWRWPRVCARPAASS